ncbi:MAG: hypothetical protein VXY77_01870 [Pseudomonadota bacterium]|nr:hypothetical protein [Pseudomonadota bacterium]
MPILFSILLALSHFTALASPKMTAGQVSLLEKIILGYYYEPSKLIKPLGDHLGSCGAFDANSHGAQHVARVASIIPYIWDIQWKNFPERRQALKDFSNYYKISTYHLRFLVQIAGIMHDSGNKYGNWHKDMPYSQKDAIWENISTKYFQDLIESPHTLSTYLPQNPKLRKELAISLSQIIQHKNTPGKIQTTHKLLTSRFRGDAPNA